MMMWESRSCRCNDGLMLFGNQVVDVLGVCLLSLGQSTMVVGVYES